MYISNLLNCDDSEEHIDEGVEESAEHHALGEQLRKTLYYGRSPGSDRPSMPLTELAVEFFRDAVPNSLRRVDMDMDFASSVGRKAYASPCSLIVGMNYVRRLKHGNPEYLQQVTSTDLFLISMLVASKYLYDEGTNEEVFNDEWADAADMETEEVNQLERDFLHGMEWNLFMNEKEFAEVLRKVEMTIAFRKGRERGHFTYTDLNALTDNLALLKALMEIMMEISKVVLVCSFAYLAFVMTIAASPAALSMATSCVEQAKPMLGLSPYTSSSCTHSASPFHAPTTDETCGKFSTKIDHLDHAFTTSCLPDQSTSPRSIVSVIKEVVMALWTLPTASSLPVQGLSQDWLTTCEFGLCGVRQYQSASMVLSCVNVTSQTSSCASSPCCCCQSIPSLNDPHATFPQASVTAAGFQTEAVR